MAICVGCGLDVNENGVLSVQRNPETGTQSGLACANDLGLSLAVVHAANTCGLVHSGSGTTVSPLLINLDLGDAPNGLACDNGLRVDVSENACNAISVQANGLYAPCMNTITGQTIENSVNSGDLPINPAVPGPGYNFLSPTVTVENTNDCFSYSGRVSVRVGGLQGILEPGTLIAAFLTNSFDGGAQIVVTPETTIVKHNNHDVNDLNVDFNNLEDSSKFDVAAGASHTFAYNLRLIVSSGSAILNSPSAGGVFFKYAWDLCAINAC